jgi:hypothetical protein
LEVIDPDPAVAAANAKLRGLDSETEKVARFLLGGFIFSGFAQASETMHYLQPKRARFFLGLTAAPDVAGNFSAREESAIFEAAARRLDGTEAKTRRPLPVPPVLPYLLSRPNGPATAGELLAQTLEFRASPEGLVYRELVETIRADGVRARRAEDLVKEEWRRALDLLAPYSKLKQDDSQSLEVTFSSELIGVPGVEVPAKLRVPGWLRLWWNDKVPFGGLRKQLRRMWMDAASYEALSKKLSDLWVVS